MTDLHGSVPMDAELKKISCPPECGFEMKSHDEKELVDLVMMHAKNYHADMGYTKEDIQGLVKKA